MLSSECVLPRSKNEYEHLYLFSQFIVHFHQAVLENNLAEITVAYDSGWNRLTEKHYAKTEWPEAEVIAPLVNDGSYCAHPCRPVIFIDVCRPAIPHTLPRAILPTCVLPVTT